MRAHDITMEDIAALQRLLERFHDGHSQQYGPMDTCAQSTCREAKMAIWWLVEQAARMPDKTASQPNA